ncbi:hypothetical protein HFP89_14925 [Wenzhouxiangella sp. XN79A]|uniref:hypothetical protein n=1 Tax=Wenzhouxiangella sp. XN79A TaxID=2724193 RepID=UPI00144AA791|nr:hypothetical protein [Wenzhouxiangella sp. XN79A]NKI36461.1 hypothetical protein [Wenzhouxiangella sp. XN79A]
MMQVGDPGLSGGGLMGNCQILTCCFIFLGLSSSSLGSSEPLQDVFTQAEAQLWKDATKTCAEALLESEALNAPQLLAASETCSDEEDRAFLAVAGQIRSGADSQAFKPLGDLDELVIAALVMAQAVAYGNSPTLQLLRDPSFLQRLTARINVWVPRLAPDYRPGWEFRNDIDPADYEMLIGLNRTEMLLAIAEQSEIVQDDEYFAAYVEAEEIMERNGGSLVPDDPDYDRYVELSDIIARVATRIRDQAPSRPVDMAINELVLRPDRSDTFRQIYSGMRGVDKSVADTFESAEAVHGSWLATSVSEDELADLIDLVDFGSEILVAISSGRRQNATGNIHIVDVSYNGLLQIWSVTGRVGVHEDGCGFGEDQQFPFALAVAPRPDGQVVSSGYSISNYADLCWNAGD